MEIHPLADDLFRRESGRLVALLTRVLGTENLQLAEDVVQDTLFQAMETWKVSGPPDKPAAWLFQVAKNKAIDALRRQRHALRFDPSDPERILLGSEYTLAATVETLWTEGSLADDLLGMMFACCLPELAPESQITLILKTLCGFGTTEIAQAFFVPEDTISKRLYRAKEFFRARRIRPEIPPDAELAERLEPVLAAVYLIFNEGYRTTHDARPIRADLMTEALFLGKLLAENRHTSDPRIHALMALMCFQAARHDGRIDAAGALVLLPDQDRSRWDRGLIGTGLDYLDQAAQGEAASAYHFEAAIAREHCLAPAFAATDWARILDYYDALCALGPSPAAELNRIIARMQAEGPEAAEKALTGLAGRFDWEGQALYHALRGEIRTRLGDSGGARSAYTSALGLSRSAAERTALQAKLDGLEKAVSKSRDGRSSLGRHDASRKENP